MFTHTNQTTTWLWPRGVRITLPVCGFYSFIIVAIKPHLKWTAAQPYLDLHDTQACPQTPSCQESSRAFKSKIS